MKDIRKQATKAAEEFYEESIVVSQLIKDLYAEAYYAGYQARAAEDLVDYAATRLKDDTGKVKL